MIYLTGIDNSIKTAREMGITTLTDKNQYGLTLVLGGGEVNLLDMTSAYSVFADNGNRHPYQKILRVEDADGNVLEEYKDAPQTVLPKNTTLMISDVLSDIEAKKPLYGENSPLYFYDRDVAAKTGTTNDYRDAWTVGYTPSLAVGAWAGNNDNTPMEKKASGLIIAPLWAEFMRAALKDKPVERFEKPQDLTDTTKTKPVMRGIWQGDENFFIDKISGKLATIDTPKETVVEKNITNVKSILYWVNKKDPQGPAPENPSNDPQFNHWNIPIQDWWSKNSYKYPITTEASKPTSFDDVHTNNKKPVIQIIEPKLDQIYDPNEKIKVSVSSSGFFPLKKLDIFVNGIYTGTAKTSPFDFYFTPNDLTNIQETNEIKIVAEDVVYNTSEEISEFKILTNTF